MPQRRERGEGALTFDANANMSITYPLEGLKSQGFDWSLANPQQFTIRHISTREINSTP